MFEFTPAQAQGYADDLVASARRIFTTDELATWVTRLDDHFCHGYGQSGWLCYLLKNAVREAFQGEHRHDDGYYTDIYGCAGCGAPSDDVPEYEPDEDGDYLDSLERDSYEPASYYVSEYGPQY
jgi:hypothetical protein